MQKKLVRRIVAGIAVLVAAAGTWYAWRSTRPDEPGPGFVSGNGRIEATEVDVATRMPGRVRATAAAVEAARAQRTATQAAVEAAAAQAVGARSAVAPATSAHEQSVLTEVTRARAQATSIQATPAVLNDPAAFARYAQAQNALSGSLSRLLAVSENYPDLKADRSFRDLQAQLEGTENRITVARNRYIKAVQDYNVTVRSFPSNLTANMFGFPPRPNFTVENEAAIRRAPGVSFGADPATGNGSMR